MSTLLLGYALRWVTAVHRRRITHWDWLRHGQNGQSNTAAVVCSCVSRATCTIWGEALSCSLAYIYYYVLPFYPWCGTVATAKNHSFRRGSTSSLSHFHEPYGAASVAPMWFSFVLRMWNTMECKRDSFNGSPGGASETHWECVSHWFKREDCKFEFAALADIHVYVGYMFARRKHTRGFARFGWPTNT